MNVKVVYLTGKAYKYIIDINISSVSFNIVSFRENVCITSKCSPIVLLLINSCTSEFMLKRSKSFTRRQNIFMEFTE